MPAAPRWSRRGSRPTCTRWPGRCSAASDTSKGCAARLAGIAPPSFPDEEKTFADLQARIDKTIAFLQSVKPEQIDGSEAKPIEFKAGPNTLKFTGESYLLGFVLPNFFFHAPPPTTSCGTRAWRWASWIISGRPKASARFGCALVVTDSDFKERSFFFRHSGAPRRGEPGIHIHHRAYGFRARASRARNDEDNFKQPRVIRRVFRQAPVRLSFIPRTIRGSGAPTGASNKFTPRMWACCIAGLMRSGVDIPAEDAAPSGAPLAAIFGLGTVLPGTRQVFT
jgi:hypothetical protein